MRNLGQGIWQPAGFYDRSPPPMLLKFVFDGSMPSGQWKTVGDVVIVHCDNCAARVAEALLTDPPTWDDPTDVQAAPPAPAPVGGDSFQRRADGWPLCPSCGEDELWSGFIPRGEFDRTLENYLGQELRCYRCPNVVIAPGAALPPRDGR